MGEKTAIFVTQSCSNFVRLVCGPRHNSDFDRWHWLCLMRACRAIGEITDDRASELVRIHVPSCACAVCRMHLDSFDTFRSHAQPCSCRHCRWVSMHVAYLEALR
jgi:hypothetical protein